MRPTPEHQQAMDAIARTCWDCKHRAKPRAACADIGSQFGALMFAAQPFCPRGLHNGAKVPRPRRRKRCQCGAPKGWRKVWHGVVGIAKWAARFDRTLADVVVVRKAACAACKHRTGYGTCRRCGCLLRAKIMVASESCGAWRRSVVQRPAVDFHWIDLPGGHELPKHTERPDGEQAEH